MPENTLDFSIKLNKIWVEQNNLWSICQREDQPTFVKAANFQREAELARVISHETR